MQITIMRIHTLHLEVGHQEVIVLHHGDLTLEQVLSPQEQSRSETPDDQQPIAEKHTVVSKDAAYKQTRMSYLADFAVSRGAVGLR